MEAASIFDSVIKGQPKLGGVTPGPAQAWAGRALIDLRHGDAKAALFASSQSFAALDAVRAMYDVRIQATLLRTRSAVLLASGDPDGAIIAAQEAVRRSQRTDAPGSAAISSARHVLDAALLAKAQRKVAKKPASRAGTL